MEQEQTMSTTGSVYQRKDGYWVASVVVAGKKIVKYGKSKREAQQRLTELVGAASMGTLTAPTRLTLREWVERWLTMQEQEKRPSTLRTYRQVLPPVIERLGHVRLAKLTPLQLAVTFTELRHQGMGTRRLQQAYVVLGTVLRQAVQLDLIGSNPLERVPKPRHEPKENSLWTLNQAQQFLRAAETSGHRYAPLFLILVATGIRIGEALGLRWSDIDLTRQTVTVQRAFVYAGSSGSLQRPKTRAGRRVVTLPDTTVRLLRRLPRPLDPEAPVILTGTGTIPNQSNLRRELHRLCQLAGVPLIPIHGLRHVHAALLVAQGVDPHALRRRLGHARVATTLDVYAYAVTPDEATARAFDQLTSTIEQSG
jgi:integrase